MLVNQKGQAIVSVGDETSVRTTNQLFQQDTQEKREGNVGALFKAGMIGAGIYGGLKLMPPVSFKGDSEYFRYLNYASAKNLGGGITDPIPFSAFKRSGEYGLGDAFVETIRKVEELSPGKLFRTFQTSHLLTPYTLNNNIKYQFGAKEVATNEDYFRKLLAREGNMQLDSQALRYGFVLEDNKLFGVDEAGKKLADKVYLNEARLVFPHFKVPKLDKESGEIRTGLYTNKIFKNYARALGTKWDVDTSLKEGGLDFSVIGGKSKSAMNFQYGVRALGRTVVQKGAEVFDKPFAFLEEYFAEESGPRKALDKLRINMGTAGKYDLGVRKTMWEMSKNISSKLAIGGVAYYGLDAIFRNTAPEDSYFKNGILAGLTASYANFRVGYAKVVSDNFQDLKQSQEEIAPGSTSPVTLLGLPLSFGMAGGMAAYGRFLRKNSKDGYEAAVVDAHSEKTIFRGVSFAKNWKGTRMKRYALRGAALGLALEAPFIPGALLTGDSSQELEEEYYGDKEVPVYTNRWWAGGGGPWEGGKIKYFRPSMVKLLMNDVDTKAEYGDYETKAKLNPFLHPFDYLRDPYRKEKMLDEERPYPIWGMDVSAGSFLGKAFERTIGQLIKPDVLNPRMMAQQGDGSFPTTTDASPGDASLISEGKMLAPPSPRIDANLEAAKWSYAAFKDFIGIKGFALDQFEESLGVDLDSLSDVQLARSGEMSNSARMIRDLNVGGMLGLGEAQRRIIPTNSGAIQDRANPLDNQMPSWLPSNTDDFYIDFSKGDAYSAVEMGNARLPGKGYEELHPELSGTNPEDYPDLYKYKILADVALGSDEYYHLRKRVDRTYVQGLLNESELKIYSEIKRQEIERAKTKQFFEYKTAEDLERLGMAAPVARYWEMLSHTVSEPIYEKLSPVRPSSKFIHQRSAVEDYEATQIDTGDAAMWDKPYEHYISPFLTQAIRGLGFDYKPDKTEERYEVEEYFDKLQYMKYRQLYKEALVSGDRQQVAEYKKNYRKTVQGSLASGLEDEKDVLYAFIALPKREREYFGAFVNTNEEERDDILELVPSRIGALYQELWARKDIIASAYDESTGAIDPEQARAGIQAQGAAEDEELAKGNAEAYNNYKNNKALQAQGSFREYLADLDAQQYIANTTGVPDKEFIGWDPRIDLKDVKLRTLSVGNEDLYEYGFFKSDLDSLKRMIAVLNEKQVTAQVEQIKANTKNDKALEEEIRQALIKEKLDPKEVELRRTQGQNQVTFSLTESDDQ